MKNIFENGLLQFCPKQVFYNIGHAFGYEIGFAIKAVGTLVNYIVFPFSKV